MILLRCCNARLLMKKNVYNGKETAAARLRLQFVLYSDRLCGAESATSLPAEK